MRGNLDHRPNSHSGSAPLESLLLVAEKRYIAKLILHIISDLSLMHYSLTHLDSSCF